MLPEFGRAAFLYMKNRDLKVSQAEYNKIMEENNLNPDVMTHILDSVTAGSEAGMKTKEQQKQEIEYLAKKANNPYF
jgi:hypothetical protein